MVVGVFVWAMALSTGALGSAVGFSIAPRSRIGAAAWVRSRRYRRPCGSGGGRRYILPQCAPWAPTLPRCGGGASEALRIPEARVASPQSLMIPDTAPNAYRFDRLGPVGDVDDWSGPVEVVLPEVWVLSPDGGRADGEEAA